MQFDDESDEQAGRRRRLTNALVVLAGLGVLAGMALLIVHFAGGEAPRKPGVQQVALLKQPPPPPPKPPEKEPEPPKVKEEVKIDEPKAEPKPDDPKPADDKPASDKPLGVDADATAGSDGFGLAANRGGRDMLLSGSGGGGGTGRYYTGLLQRNFQDALSRNRKAPQGEFNVVVRVWLGEDGRVQRTEIVNGSGNAETDALIQSTLADMAPLREVPPPSLRVVQLRLNRRA